MEPMYLYLWKISMLMGNRNLTMSMDAFDFLDYFGWMDMNKLIMDSNLIFAEGPIPI